MQLIINNNPLATATLEAQAEMETCLPDSALQAVLLVRTHLSMSFTISRELLLDCRPIDGRETPSTSPKGTTDAAPRRGRPDTRRRV